MLVLLAMCIAGVCATAIEECEEKGITSLTELKGAWTLRSDRSNLMMKAEAVLLFVFGKKIAGSRQHCPDISSPADAEREKPRKKLRGDMPRPQLSAGGSLQRALEAIKPENRDVTMANYKKDIWANSARASQGSRLRTLEALASAWPVNLTPVTEDVVHKIATGLKAGGYRSARQYISRLRRAHVEATRTALSAEAELAMKDAIRSIERGIGGTPLKDSIQLENLFVGRVKCGECERAIVVVGSWFLLREIELAALRRGHILLDHDRQRVSLTLWASKTDTVGNLVTRTHRCCCGVLHSGICPYHTAAAYVKNFKGDPKDPLFAKIPGVELEKSETVEIIRQVLLKHGVPLTRPGPDGLHPEQRFGGHVLRVAGSQFLTRLKVPLPAVMLIGRWGYRAIERYVQDVALDDFDIVVPKTGARNEQLSHPSNAVINELREKVEKLALSVEQMQLRPEFIVAKKVHRRDDNEATTLPWQWRAKGCGWPYGMSAFTRCARVEDEERCKRCFPEVVYAEPEVTEDESSSESKAASSSSSSKEDE